MSNASRRAMGSLSAEQIGDNTIYVNGNEIPGVLPGCQIDCEILLGRECQQDVQQATRNEPAIDECYVDGPVFGEVNQNGQFVRKLTPEEAEAAYILCGGSALDDLFCESAFV